MKTRVLIAIPAYNEETVITKTVVTLRSFADQSLPEYETILVVADNGSTDGTARVATGLAANLSGVRYLRTEERGKGNAIAAAWRSAEADIYAFMDADLSTDLAALPALISAVRDGADLAMGSRYHAASSVKRSRFRRAISRAYRAVARVALGTRLADLPCGFKAVSAVVARDLMPSVGNRTWFFDSELAVRAERMGYRVAEIPVSWTENDGDERRSKASVPRVMAEYLREMIRLRLELGPLPLSAEAVADRKEWRFAAGLAAALMIVTSIAPAYAWWTAERHGLEWTGRMAFSPGDLAVYLSQISQAAHGSFFLVNQAGAPGATPLPNVVWWTCGLFAKSFSLRPLVAYQLLRVLLIPALVATLMGALRHFLSVRRERALALLLLAFGSGVGMLYASVMGGGAEAGIQWPTDLWVAESNVFTSAVYSPHFIASWMLMIAALTRFSISLERRSFSSALVAGVIGALLLSFHPFYAITLVTVAAAWAAAFSRTFGQVRERLGLLATFVLPLSIPAAFYFRLVMSPDDYVTLVESNVLDTPRLAFVFLGFAGFAILAPLGQRLLASREDMQARRSYEVMAWMLTILFLSYWGLSFERRLLEGLQFPMVIFAAPALLALWDGRLAGQVLRPSFRQGVVGFMAVIIFLPSTFYVIVREFSLVTQRQEAGFRAKDISLAFDWLRKNARRDSVVLSSPRSGNNILGWAERPVYAGHWAQTADLERKASEIAAFYGRMDSNERLAFMRDRDIVYVFEGPAERSYGRGLQDDPAFSIAYVSGDYVVYEKAQSARP